MASEMTSSEVISNANMADKCNIFKHPTWAHQDPVLPRCHRSPSLPQSLMTCTVIRQTRQTHFAQQTHARSTTLPRKLPSKCRRSIPSPRNFLTAQCCQSVELTYSSDTQLQLFFFCWAIAAASRPTMPSWPPYSLNIKAHAKNMSVLVREWFYS